MYKVYNLAPKGSHPELNLAIVNKDKIILLEKDGQHTVTNLHESILLSGETGLDIITNFPVVEEVGDVGLWVRTFGRRIEHNYQLFLDSVKKIGLNPNDFPRNGKENQT